MAKRVNESLDFNSGAAKIINLPAPASAGDAATKAYVDALPSGLKFIEQPVRAASLVNVTVASPGATIDGVAPTSGVDRILLVGQTTANQNGTYIWNGAASPMTRTTDVFITGSVVFSTGDGTANGNIGFILTTDAPITLGTTSLTFVPGFRVISAGTGLQQSGNVMSLISPVTVANGGTGASSAPAALTNLGGIGAVGGSGLSLAAGIVSLAVPVTIANGGTNAITAAAALTSLGAVRNFEADFGNASLSTFTFTPTTIAKYPHVQVVNNSTGAIEDAQVTITPGSPTGGVYTPSIVVTSETWASAPPALNAYHVTILG
jgi:hypothetical protein